MKNKNTDETTAPPTEIPPDAIRLAFSIHLYGRDETICRFSSDFDIPLGLRSQHLCSTSRAIGIMFEHSVQIPTIMAAREFIEARLKLRRKENLAREARERGESAAPSPFAGFMSQEALAEFEKKFGPLEDEGELPNPPSSFSEPSFPPAVPKTFVANPPAQPPGNKELKKAA